MKADGIRGTAAEAVVTLLVEVWIDQFLHIQKLVKADAFVLIVVIVFPFFLMRISRTFSSAKPIKLI
jgi:hypothetical protein